MATNASTLNRADITREFEVKRTEILRMRLSRDIENEVLAMLEHDEQAAYRAAQLG